MSLILCTDTSTKACTTSVSMNGDVLSRKLIHEEGFSHAEHLHLLINDVVRESGKSWKDLSAVAIGKGPGSYTGLRIGVSAAKGICYALGIPLIAIPSLKIIAASAKADNTLPKNALIRPMIDARRMEVYTASYSLDMDEYSPCVAEIIEDDSFADELNNRPVYFCGDGMEKCRETFQGNSNAHFLTEVVPAAWSMARLATEAYTEKRFEDVAYFEPFYLKEFMAKLPKKMV